MQKYASEISYWQKRYNEENKQFRNDWYKELMKKILATNENAIFNEKVLLDFGCGPRGSLTWANMAKRRIGANVLAQSYLEKFENSMRMHNMEYLKQHKHIFLFQIIL